jgi:MFS family permease
LAAHMPHELRSARIAVVSTFAIHGFVSGSWAPRIPAFKDDLGLDNGDLGIALSGLAVGLFLGTRVAGRPIDRIGTRLPLRVGLPLMCVALVGPAVATDLLTLTLAFAWLGLVSGFLDVAMNANAVAVERGYRQPILSGVHAFWSIGLLAGSSVGAAAAALGAGVTFHFALAALVLALLAVLATRSLLSSDVDDAPERAAGELRRAFTIRVVLLGLVAFSAFAGEGPAADWSAVYMDETVGVGEGFAGVAFVAFSIGMIASRLVGDAVSRRFGPVQTVRLGGALAATGLALALAAPQPATAIGGYLLFGTGLGPVVPIAFSAAGNLDRRRAGALLGVVVTIGYVGSVLGPVVIGFAAEAASLRVALLLPAALAVLVAASASSVGSAAGRTSGPRSDVART